MYLKRILLLGWVRKGSKTKTKYLGEGNEQKISLKNNASSVLKSWLKHEKYKKDLEWTVLKTLWAAVSVTRYWNKTLPKCLQHLPKM